MVSTEEAAYFAGLFDGEGSVGIRCNTQGRQYYSYILRIAITNTHQGIIEQLQNKFAGSIYFLKRYSPAHRQAWYWDLYSRSAFDFLKIIYPYSIIKKPQIELAMKFQEQCIHKSVGYNKNKTLEQTMLSEFYKHQISQLNHGLSLD